MRAIYKPRGRAREYCQYALNLYTGCQHGCKYCYVPKYTYKKHDDFVRYVKPRYGIIEQLEKEAHFYKGKHVLLSFTSDPYQPIEEFECLTRQALVIMLKYGIIPVILTKGKIADRDFDILKKSDSWFGVTLTFIEATDSLEWEPLAALPDERITLLKKAKEQGIKTWVSIEPVISPEQSLVLIKETSKFVDLYKVGKLNHHELASQIDWHNFASNVVSLLKELKKPFYIKEDLRAYLKTNQEE
ncbi:radical SAM protein [Candidatus Sumerlaeota bacterium]|nr:radical SAM protein [Candidatus Sumerlaeota bacterium]